MQELARFMNRVWRTLEDGGDEYAGAAFVWWLLTWPIYILLALWDAVLPDPNEDEWRAKVDATFATKKNEP